MNIYLMRHANAGLSRRNPLLDVKRGLVKEGKEQCVLMALALAAVNAQVDVVVSSPLKRALQTAQFVATEIGVDSRVEINAALSPEGDIGAFHQMLTDYEARGLEGILAVGHNPNLYQFLGKLVTGNGGANLRLRKAAIARVDMERHPPQLQWMLDPRTVRALYLSAAKSSRPKTSRK